MTTQTSHHKLPWLPSLAAAVLLGAIFATLPVSNATGLDAGACAGFDNTVATSTYSVPAGASVVFDHPTAIIANQVAIFGQVRTIDATPGADAPALCIRTTDLTLGSTAILCTGAGHDGTPDYARGNQTSAAGTAGTSGGPLTFDLASVGILPSVPHVTLMPGALLCTGTGGNGGSATMGDPCHTATSMPLPIGLGSREAACEAIGGAPGCEQVAVGLPSRDDPCELPNLGSPTCGQVVEALNRLVGAFRQDPCDLPLCPGLQPSTIALATLLTEGCPIPPVPSCEQYAGMVGNARFDPCALPEVCQQNLNSLETDGLLYALMTCLPSPCIDCPTAPGICEILNGEPLQAIGAIGGDAGPLHLNFATTPTLLSGPGQVSLGAGGNGGFAAIFGGGSYPRTANGGPGGASWLSINGVPSTAPTFGATPAGAWLVQNLQSFSGGTGGSGGHVTMTDIDTCGKEPLPPECQDITEILGPYLVFCLLQYILQFVPIPCGPIPTPLPPPLDHASLVGCPGDPAQVMGARYTGGPQATGHAGDNGEAGEVDYSVGAGYPLGVSGSVSCSGANDDAQDGQSPATLPTDGDYSHARASDGGYGILLGGHGGNAFVQGAEGGLGMSGGNGGAGDHYDNSVCHEYVRPGNGGNAQTGGDSGPGDAYGGFGGPSFLQGGRGGDATTQFGNQGSGGNGGNSGAVTWVDAAVANDCSAPPSDHGVAPTSCIPYGCGGLDNGCIELHYVGRGDQGCRGLKGTLLGVIPHPGDGGQSTLTPPGPPGLPNGPHPPQRPGADGTNGTGDPSACP